MDIRAIRKANLNLLMKEAGNSRQAVARAAGTSPAYISQLRSFKTKAYVGHDLARRLEAAMGKPRGWMDQEHASDGAILSSVVEKLDSRIVAAVAAMIVQLAPETERQLSGILGRVSPEYARRRATGVLDESTRTANQTPAIARRPRRG